MKTSKSKVGEKDTWWGVHRINEAPVYLYKNLHAAQNQASRDKSSVVSPFYVFEQTPHTQDTLKIEGHEFKWSTITIVIVGAFLLGYLIRLIE